MADIYREKSTGEWMYPADAYILSETDSKGIIIYANDIFCEIAGYTLKELIGEPHNLVRHPDMPRIAFKGLWDDVQSKGFWTGYVKNMSKDRGFYWVYATVLRKIASNGSVSYLSVRVKPSRKDVEFYSKLYSDLKAKQ